MQTPNNKLKQVPIETVAEGEELRLVEDGPLYVVKEMFFDSEPESKINRVATIHYRFIPHGTLVYIAEKETPKTKVYICGKITGMEEQAEINFQQAEENLVRLGFEVVNPMKLPHQHDKSWESYMRECIKSLCDCDAIYVMPNAFDNSRGAKMEMEIARELQLMICLNIENISAAEKIVFNKL